MDPLEDEDLLTEILRALVNDPSQVKVSTWTKNGIFNMDIHVAPEDCGHVIGKEGSTIGAIRTIFRKVGHLDRRRISVNLIDSDSERSQKRRSRDQSKQKEGRPRAL